MRYQSESEPLLSSWLSHEKLAVFHEQPLQGERLRRLHLSLTFVTHSFGLCHLCLEGSGRISRSLEFCKGNGRLRHNGNCIRGNTKNHLLVKGSKCQPFDLKFGGGTMSANKKTRQGARESKQIRRPCKLWPILTHGWSSRCGETHQGTSKGLN